MTWAPVSSGGPAAAAAVADPPTGAPTPARGYTDRRPGFVPMRPMAMGEILDGAMGMLRQAPAATLGIGAIVSAIQAFLTIPLQFLSSRFTFSLFDLSDLSGSDPFLTIVGFGASAMATGVVVTTCAGIIAGFMAGAVGDSSLGRPVTLRGVWLQTRPRLWALTGLSLFIGLVTLLGAGALGLGWLFFTGVFAVAVPVLMLERATMFQAISRSWHLTIKDFFRVLGIRLLAILVAVVLGQILALPLTLAGEGVLIAAGTDPSDLALLLSVFCTGVGVMIGSLLTAPFLGCVDAFIYIDRRMRSEGLDIEMKYRMPVQATPARSA